MSDHDPLCEHDGPSWCECALITRVRADERDAVAEDIAIAIENWDEGSRLREWQRTASTIARSFRGPR